MSVDIVIADDHTILCQALANLIDGRDDIHVVGTAGDGVEALRLVREHRPDVLLIDITMPNLNGIDATYQALEACPSCRVIALSVHREESILTSMLRAGARGYLLKDCAHGELQTAIRTVMKGQTYLSPGVTNLLVNEYLRGRNSTTTNHSSSQLESFTQRERQILQLIAEGLASKEIAGALGISIKTVDTHRRRIMMKTGVTTVAGLTKAALRLGLTSMDY